MSDATNNFVLPINWDIDVYSDFQTSQFIETKLGYIFNDVWHLSISNNYKKRMNLLRISLKRKRADKRIKTTFKLKFTDPHCYNSLEVQYVKFYKRNRRLSYFLKKEISDMFYTFERISITGEVQFQLVANLSVIYPETLSTLSTDFKKLLYNDKFSDVILKCGSEVFTAHKFILSTRSPVFSQILEQNKSADVKIDINDIAPHVLKAVLYFIYCGQTEHLTFQSACELLTASDKYGLNELKPICINYIKSSLTVDNVLDCFENFEEAKSHCIEFIVENISEVKRIKQWQNFKRQFPNVVAELDDSLITEDTKQCMDVKQEFPGIKNPKY